MSSHDLDLTHWMLKSDPIEVVARDVSGVLQGRGVDAADGLNALIRFGNGASANFHTSWIHPNTYPKIADGYIQFIGSEGAIFYNNRTRTAEIFNTRGGHKVEFTGPHTADEVEALHRMHPRRTRAGHERAPGAADGPGPGGHPGQRADGAVRRALAPSSIPEAVVPGDAGDYRFRRSPMSVSAFALRGASRKVSNSSV